MPKISKTVNTDSQVHTIVSRDIRNFIGNSCIQICNLSESLYDIRRMKAYFSVDDKDRLHFVWAESMRFSNCNEKKLRPLVQKTYDIDIMIKTSKPVCFFCDNNSASDKIVVRKANFDELITKEAHLKSKHDSL